MSNPGETDEDPQISHAVMTPEEADRLVGQLLKDNIEIARELQDFILNTSESGPAELAVWGEDKIEGTRTLSEIHGKTRSRLQALLTEPAEQRRQAVQFLEGFLQLARLRAGLDPTLITNSSEHIRATVELIEKVGQLMRQFKAIEAILETSLQKEDGVIKCNSQNAVMLRNGLDFAARQISHLRDLRAIPAATYATEDGDMAKPSQGMVDLFVKLRDGENLENDRGLIRIIEQLSDYLQGLVSRTGLYVEIDTRRSVDHFRLLAEEIEPFELLARNAEAKDKSVSQVVEKEWGATLIDTSFELALPMTRAEMLYQPMTEDFLRLMDLEAMDKETVGLIRKKRDIKKSKNELLRRQKSLIRKMLFALRMALFPAPQSPPQTMAQLNARQGWLGQRIRELGRAKEQRRRLER